MTRDGQIRLDDYRAVVPTATLDLLRRLAERIRGRSLVHVNSTRVGGGVAEMLHRYVPLFTELGIATRWEVISGAEEFFRVTKSFHNALQGQEQAFTNAMFQSYLETNKENAVRLNLDADVVLVHDPQPAALIAHARPASDGKRRGRGVRRWHTDHPPPQRPAAPVFRPFAPRDDAPHCPLPQILHS